jgi:hypothetical protein
MAYETALKAHGDQKRRSGMPYITHPLEVAKILVELGMDTESVVGALLHDVVEDTDTSLQAVEKQFGKEIALLVGGVTKLGQIPYSSKEEQQAENLRKCFLLWRRMCGLSSSNWLTAFIMPERSNSYRMIKGVIKHLKPWRFMRQLQTGSEFAGSRRSSKTFRCAIWIQ